MCQVVKRFWPEQGALKVVSLSVSSPLRSELDMTRCCVVLPTYAGVIGVRDHRAYLGSDFVLCPP